MRNSKQPRVLHGTILRLQNYCDTDRIVEVLSQEEGRISLFARGARASKKRFMGVLDLFASLRMQVTPREGLWILQSAEVLNLRLGIRESWSLFTRANVLCDCVRALSAEGQATPELLDALLKGLDHLANGDEIAAAQAYPRILQAAGIMPDLRRLGFPCLDIDAANRAESSVLLWIENHLGFSLNSRVVVPHLLT
jgi:DNA repair protein RecO (recombination protein O)